jgi:signal transduction histidine kinase/ActR/RegA family two-component response regulator
MVTCGAIFLAVTATVLWTEGRSLLSAELREESTRYNEEFGLHMVGELGQQVAATHALARSLADLATVLPHDEILMRELIPRVMDYEHSQELVAGGGVWPEPYVFDAAKERRSFFWGRDAQGELRYYDDYNSASSAGYHHEEWYVPARYVEPGAAFWSKSYIDPYSHEPMVTCTVPIYSHGAFSGVSTIDLRLDGLRDFFARLTESTGGYAFAVDRNNKFLSFPDADIARESRVDGEGHSIDDYVDVTRFAAKHPRFAPVAEELAACNERLVRQAVLRDERVRSRARALAAASYQIAPAEALTLAATLSDPLRKTDVENPSLASLDLGEDLLLGRAATVQIFHVPHTYWKVVTVMPVSSAVAAAWNITGGIGLWILLAAALASMGAYLLARHRILRPVQEMISCLDGAVAVEDPRRTPRLSEEGGSELSLLAHRFNRQSDQLVRALEELSKSRDDLEVRVEERTREIEEGRRRLQQHNEELMDARLRAERVGRSKAEFIANTSHQIRGPLLKILAISESIGQGELDTAQRQNLEQLVDTGRVLLAEIDEMLDFSRIDAGQLTLHPAPTSISDLALDCAQLLRPLAGARGLELEATVAENLPASLVADSERVRQVLLNLLDSAIKSTETGSVDLHVSYQPTSDLEGRLGFSVTDTGAGVPDDVAEPSFDEVARLHSADPGRFGGSGLGLALSRRLARLMGGDIFLDAEYRNGCRFLFMLPVSLPQLEPAPVEPSSIAANCRGRALVVEDNQANRDVMRHWLSHFGMEVHMATNGLQALEDLEQLHYDIVFMDLHMPEMDGIETTRRIRELPPPMGDVPVVAVTACALTRDRQECVEVGMNGYLAKPVTKQDLLGVLADHLEPLLSES